MPSRIAPVPLFLLLCVVAMPVVAQYGASPGDVSVPPPAARAETTPTVIDDRRFFRAATQAGLAGIELAAVAGAKASADDVRRYAQDIAEDHARANAELRELAAAASDDVLPTAPGSGQMTLKNDLASRSGSDFDRAYARAMLDEQRKSVALFERAARSADPDVRGYAERRLPVLRRHLAEAQALDRSHRDQ